MAQDQASFIVMISLDIAPEIVATLEARYVLHLFTDPKEAARALQNIRCDLMIVDNAAIKNNTFHVVQDIKRRFPAMPMIVLSDKSEPKMDQRMMSLDVDGLFPKVIAEQELCDLIELILKQSAPKHALIQLNRNLQTLASLPRLLFSSLDPQSVIKRAVKLTRTTFNLYGVVIVLYEDGVLQAYIGSEGLADVVKVALPSSPGRSCNPWSWAIQNKAVQAYSDIKLNPHYRPISQLPAAESVVIMPLARQDVILGAIGLYTQPGYAPTDADLMIYEQVATQVVVALHNANVQQAQASSIESSQVLLHAWQVFANLATVDDIEKKLVETLNSLSQIKDVLLWVEDSAPASMYPMARDSQDGHLVEKFNERSRQGLLKDISNLLGGENVALLLSAETIDSRPLNKLFEAMAVQQIIVVPMITSGRLLGVVLSGIGNPYNLHVEHINLVEHLVNIGALALQRTLLTNSIAEKNSRLEGILHGVSEAIFFVNNNNTVAFCNPQLAELTHISASVILDKEAEVLLRAIADETADPDQTYARLYAGKAAVTDPDTLVEEYPIVALSLAAERRDLTLEYLKIQGEGAPAASWAGVIHDATRSGKPSQFQDLIVTSMSESMRLPYAQARSLLDTLLNEHGYFSYRERETLLADVKNHIENMGQLWNTLREAYEIEAGKVTLKRESVSIEALLEQIQAVPFAGKARRNLNIKVTPDLPTIKVDEFHFRAALINIVQYLLSSPSDSSAIDLSAHKNDVEVLIQVKDASVILSSEQQQVLASANLPSNASALDIGLYVAREIITRHGGRIFITANNPTGTVINVALPLAVRKPLSAPVDIVETKPEQPARSSNRAPNRTLQRIMMVVGQSSLAHALEKHLAAEYEVLTYQSGDEALQNLTSTRWDLVIIDVGLSTMESTHLCKRIRQQTEIPIILIADKSSDTDKVQGLHAGADDYITKPISEEEMKARIMVIFKRQYIPARTTEPLAVGELQMDFARREVFVANKPVELTRIEYDLLYHLVMNRGKILTHKQLLEKVWGPDYRHETQYLWVNISRLRKKLETNQNSAHYIHTQSGTGYFFDVL